MRTKNEQIKWNVLGMRSTTNKYTTSLGKLVILCLAFFVALPLGAREINVPTQPVSPYADSEVSTNLVLNASRTDVKELKLNLQFNATLSNNFEVAFGRDSNTNCVLDVEEIETTYGWRGGKYFIENVSSWDRFEEDIIVDGTNGVMDVTIEVGANFSIKSFTAICDGESAFGELSTQTPQWLYKGHWNMMRVVRRGTEPTSEWIRCTVNYNHVLILVR